MQNNFAVAVGNMGEVYMQLCDYQNSYENLSRAGEIFAQLNNREEELNVLFLQGKFWFIIGAIDQLKQIIERYEYYSLTLEGLSEKLKLNLDFLRLLIIFIESKGFEDIKAVMTLIEKARKVGENVLATETIFLLIEDLIGKEKFSEAIEFLDDVDLVIYIKENIIFRAQREYLLGKIAYHTQNENLKSPIEYFEHAYSLLEDESIYELTWKILFTISETYWERGNFHKAKKPRHYAYELINMIGENITNSKLRSAYFNHPERKKALEKLNLIGNQTQLNEHQKN
jgi:tetratricopeptide (TPR) repeat protein